MHCASSFEIGLFGSLYFAGYLISSAIMPFFADRYGRKTLIIGGCSIQAACFLLMVLFPNLSLYFVMNFILGTTVTARGMVAYAHMMEWVRGKEGLITGLLFGYDGLVIVICPPILLYITKNTQVFLYIALAMNLLVVILFALVYFPESANYLLDQGRCDEL